MNDKLISLIPDELKGVSGSVFYSGKEAFEGKKPLYILGLNPGGSPIEQDYQTLEYHTHKNLNKSNWSEYRDESWDGKKPGTNRLQPRLLHLLEILELNPAQIPASNVVFVRTRRERGLFKKFTELANLCWPFHDYVIKSQKIKNVLCFGKTAGGFVRKKLDANVFQDEFIEHNKRKWRTQIFSNPEGINVIVATHPSIANWCNPRTDPSELIRKQINQ